MKVKLLAHTPEPEKVISMAAKLCYSPVGVDEIAENLTEESINKFLNMLVSMGHESPIEHVTFTFGIEGISRSCSHQIVRHRIASFSQQSQRYVKLDQFEYIIPPEIERNEEAKKIFIESMNKCQEDYDKLVEILFAKHYQELLDKGVSEKKAKSQAEKMSIEDARYVFPNACETKMVFTINARSLYNFFHHRCCERAQWEIRELATEMLRLVREVAPILFNNVGPNCLNGACPEGKMTSGKIKDVREGSIKKIIGMAKEKNVVIQYVDKHKLDEISTSHSHQGVIAVVSDYKYYELEDLLAIARERGEDPFFIILDEITDPHNLGTIIRTADAVGAHGVIIPKRRSVHITSVVAKASAGAVEYVPVCKVTNIANTIKQLKKEGLWIAAADMDGGVFYEQDLTGPLALVIGSEGFGVSRLVKQNCDFVVKMPMIGNVSSLNASVAGGILLYEIFRQRMKRD